MPYHGRGCKRRQGVPGREGKLAGRVDDKHDRGIDLKGAGTGKEIFQGEIVQKNGEYQGNGKRYPRPAGLSEAEHQDGTGDPYDADISGGGDKAHHGIHEGAGKGVMYRGEPCKLGVIEYFKHKFSGGGFF